MPKLLLALLLGLGASGQAEPFVPATDGEVLLVLPLGPGPRAKVALDTMKRRLSENDRDEDAAVLLARYYVNEGRALDDPRSFGMAEATLKPWWAGDAASAPILQLIAEIKSWNHDFAGALKALDGVIALDPRDHRAILARSILQQVIGNFSAAASGCAAIRALSETARATLCEASLELARGRHDAVAESLKELATPASALDPSDKAWALEMAASSEAALGHDEAAETMFLQALAYAPHDRFKVTAFIDFLLSKGRFGEVLELASGQGAGNLGVDVRAAIAMKREGKSPEALELLKTKLSKAFAREYERGTGSHQREEALFLLEVVEDAAAALKVAAMNFKTQREPIDLALLLSSAAKAGHPEAAAEARAFATSAGVLAEAFSHVWVAAGVKL